MSVTRRKFLVAVPAAGAALVFCARSGAESAGGANAGAGNANATSARNAQGAGGVPNKPPVVSFHLDQPYLDVTGLGEPYVPPAGLRSGAPLAAFSEEEMLGRFYGFI